MQQILICIHLLEYRCFEVIPYDFVPPHDTDFFALHNTHPGKLQGEHWMVHRKFYKMYSADSLGQNRYHFFKPHYNLIMPTSRQSHPYVCGFYIFRAAFQLFKVRHKDINGFQDSDVFSYLSNYINLFNNFIVHVHSMWSNCSVLNILSCFFKP